MSLRLTALLLLLSLALSAALPSSPAVAADAPIPIGPGAIHQQMHRPEGPWAIHVVEADLSEEYLELQVLLGGGDRMARRQLSAMAAAARANGFRPIAAVNGDFFSLAVGDHPRPLGLHVDGGELVTFPDPSRTAFYVLADGSAHMDRMRANAWLRGPDGLLFAIAAVNRPPGYADLALFTPRFGAQTRADPDALQIALVSLTNHLRANAEVGTRIASVTTGSSQPIPPDGAVLAARGVAAYALRKLKVGDDLTLVLGLEPEKGRIQQAVSGGPRLLRDGVVSVEHQRERFSESFAAYRHPRTGIGVRDGTVVLVAVDGRQPGYSEGMTLYEFARLFAELGCTDAMNLDGGGSTTMVVRESVVNAPSGGFERGLVNALAIVSAAPVGPPVQLALEPREVSVLGGERIPLRAVGVDQYFNPVSIAPERVAWDIPPSLGEVSDGGVLTAARVSNPTVGLVLAKVGDMVSSTVVRVAPSPARIVVTPARATLPAGGAQQFRAQAYDDGNEALALSPGRLTWRVDPPGVGARVDASGLFRAPTQDGQIAVLACVGETCGQADVVVGEKFVVVEGFEDQGRWTFRAEPASDRDGAPGERGGVEVVDDRLRASNRCLRLRYDLSEGAGTRTAHAELNLALPEARAISAAVLGDGQGAWLRARLRDAAGRAFSVDLSDRVSWSGSWRRLTAPLPEEAEQPLVLESIYLAEFRDTARPSGAIHLDDIGVAAPAVRKE